MTATASTTLTADEGHALTVAVDNLPYGGMLRGLAPGKSRGEITVDDVVDYLRLFRDELLRVSSRAEVDRRALRELEGQRDAVRSFLGIDRVIDAIPGA